MAIVKKSDGSQPLQLESTALTVQQPQTKPHTVVHPNEQTIEVDMSQNPFIEGGTQEAQQQYQPQQQQPQYQQQQQQTQYQQPQQGYQQPQYQQQYQQQQPQQQQYYQQPQPGQPHAQGAQYANGQSFYINPQQGYNAQMQAQADAYVPPARSYAGNNTNPYQLMSRPSTSISLNALVDGVKNALKRTTLTDAAKGRHGEPKVITIDQSTSKIGSELLAIATVPAPVDGRHEVLIQLLVLDTRQQPIMGFLDTGMDYNRSMGYYNNQMYVQPRVQLVPFDFIKNETKDAIRNKVMGDLGISTTGADKKPNGNCATIVSIVTIPKGFGMGVDSRDGRDQVTQNAIDQLVYMSMSALMNYYDTMYPHPLARVGILYTEAELAEFRKNNTPVPQHFILDANFTFNENTLHDTLGQPIRSDITVDISLKPINSQHNGNPIATVHGYMDLTYATTPQVYGANGFASGNVHPFEIRYCPVFVITAIRSRQNAMTISDVLIAIMACNALSNTNPPLWMNGFQSIREGDRAKSRDIRGILNEVSMMSIGAPLGKGDPGNDKSTLELIQSKFMNTMFVAMDIEESGETSWLDTILLESTTNPMFKNAIIRAADDLTQNKFSIYGGAQFQPIADNPARIHLGEYRLGQNVRDIRDLDALAILNESNPGEVTMSREWIDSIASYALNPAMHLEKRETIINQMLTSSTINRYAKRAILSGAFIKVLTDAIESIGVRIQATGVGIAGNIQGGMNAYDPRFAMVNPYLQPQMYGQPGYNQPMMQPGYQQPGYYPQQQYPQGYQQPFQQPGFTQPQPGAYQPNGFAQPITGANVWNK